MWDGIPAKPRWEDRITIPQNVFAGTSFWWALHIGSSGLRSGRMPSQSIKDMKVSWPTMYSQALVTFDASLLP